jgi:hypothetical protein
MFYGKDKPNWPLRAIKRMAESEFEARKEWKQDFEASVMDLFPNWEWRAQPIGDKDWPQVRIKDYEGRGGGQALFVEGQPINKRIRVCFLPYVRSEDPQFELWYALFPTKEGSTIHLKVGAECLDILQPVRETEILTSITDGDEYHQLEFRVADYWPDWKDQGLNMIWVEFSSPDPGFSVAVDEVYVH